jgi:hypothetical protein
MPVPTFQPAHIGKNIRLPINNNHDNWFMFAAILQIVVSEPAEQLKVWALEFTGDKNHNFYDVKL